eukprot:CAMPEP_0205800326 /NCGR_PEP_ID=MMETSP0205-20121125/1962_1 /ASSEMBLY_ACC=CAM_ASM_000278 /TAXON_ID=36767 /ORGANISM="Euplotes focardii, Strain TN1" /LENGTH=337 /DNA_ID=CAMNT_0053063257 /DNA_START=32 /DNA_END=1042 /DNA_ORIENTATION=-
MAGDKKCRALALSGGGDKGSYQASVFIEFTNLLSKEDISYDVVTGASAGSLNGAGISLFAAGDEDQAAIFIYGLWHTITTSDILKMWDGGILEGIFIKPGIFDNSPLISFLESQIGTQSIQKKFSVVVTNANTGFSESVDFNASKTIPEDAISTIVGSSAIPFAFPPMEKNGNTYIDGGCIWNLDVTGAVRRCKEIVEDEEDIIIDIILCSFYSLTPIEEIRKYGPLDHYFRGIEIQDWQNNMQDVERAVRNYPKVNFRYVIGPSTQLSGSPIPLDFSRSHLDKCFEIGKNDAIKAVGMGEGEYLNVMLDHFNKVQLGEEPNFDQMLKTKFEQNKYN